jgi:CRP/FNR family cyclic AMP-dependent transcriptional regulator
MEGTRALLLTALEQLGWPSQAASSMAKSAHAVTYEKGAMIFHAGEPADLLYVLLNGEAKIYYMGRDGERLLVSIARGGGLIGSLEAHTSSRDEGETQLFTAQALTRCKVAIIARERVARAVAELRPEEVLAVAGCMNDGWVRLSRRLLDLLTMNVRGRLVYTIQEIAQAFGISDARGKLIGLKLSHEDFGDLVGASRPMVSKHLKELAKANIFSKQNGRYVLWREDMLTAPPPPDPSKLVRLRPTPYSMRRSQTIEAPRRRASR